MCCSKNSQSIPMNHIRGHRRDSHSLDMGRTMDTFSFCWYRQEQNGRTYTVSVVPDI